MADVDKQATPEQQLMILHRQRNFQQQVDPQSRGWASLGPAYDGLPVLEPDDLGYIGPKPAFVKAFESACRDGPLSIVKCTVSFETRTPVFLHNGLLLALSAGNIEVAEYLLSAGTPIVRITPFKVLSAPPDQQIPLFELLTHYGWDPSIPRYLSHVVTNLPLLAWFLSHGANPNLNVTHRSTDGTSVVDTHSCDALERAACNGSVEAVRMLVEAGAEI